ncbi:MAG: hypothetical protein U0359_33825 [Byssovorax sp.]
MRTTHGLIAALGSVLAAAAGTGLGCGALPADCPDRYRCPDSTTLTSGTGGSTTTTGTGGTGGTGGDGGAPVACIPSEAEGPVDASCGVFVAASVGVDDKDHGAKDKPLKTLGAAIKAAIAAKKPVYACAETFVEALTLDAGVTVYGGLDCQKSWAYVGPTKKSTLSASADQVPLTMSATASGVKLFDLKIKAADAASQDPMAGSSIAVIADQATAAFTRCDIEAGNAMSGLAGETPMVDVGPMDPMDFSIVGNSGTKACLSASTTAGGAAKVNMFCMGDSPIGGGGGVGSIGTGGDGEANPANALTATGGKGQPNADPTWGCQVGQGALGLPGAPGDAGDGAKGNPSLGAIGVTGYTGVDGMPGGAGKHGQGGGGGGGAKGKAGPTCCSASGGGGGVGGCGGAARAGASAGSSIGVIDLDASHDASTW